MNKSLNLFATAVLLLLFTSASAQVHDIETVLKTIDANNLEIKASRATVESKKAEAKAQRNLANPEVSFSAMKAPDAPKSHEFSVMQQFDFPTHYVALNKMAKYQNNLAERTHAVCRRTILLQTKMLCLELIANQQKSQCLQLQRATIDKLGEFYASAFEKGDVDAITMSRIDVTKIAIQGALQQLEQTDIDLHAALQDLNAGVGVAFASAAYPLVSLPTDTASLFEQNVLEHPAMLQAQVKAQVAQQQVRTERSAALPQFGVGYKQSYDGIQTHRGLQLSVSIPIFAHRSRVKMASAEADAEAINLQLQNAMLRTQFQQQWQRAESLQRTLANMPVETLHNALRQLKLTLDERQITLQQYLQETTTIFETLQQRISLEHEYHKAIAILTQNEL
ncbi:MAG: TolC family protein [Bacteroidaceae bacterium]|nr:TolC family protein [Bacteroidaceae bacterium]